MTIYTELLPDQFLVLADFRAMTEFPTVAARSDAQLGLYLTRAHVRLEEWLDFDDRNQPDRFEAQMMLATFMVAESMALANPTRAAAAAGITSETIGKYSYSRAPGGSSTGQGVRTDLVPDEAILILERWSRAEDNVISIHRTEVFPQSALDTVDNELRRFSRGDDDLLVAGDLARGWANLGPGPRG